MVPAAFTKKTGEAHWHVLNRARAIENGAFVIAPCSVGKIEGGGECFGHVLQFLRDGELRWPLDKGVANRVRVEAKALGLCELEQHIDAQREAVLQPPPEPACVTLSRYSS